MIITNPNQRVGLFSSYHHVGVRRGKGQFQNRAWGVHDGFQVEDVAALYGYNGGVTGKGATIALLQLGGGYKASDMDKQLNDRVSFRPVLNVGNNPTGDPNGPDGEVGLDIQVSGKVAKGSNIRVYFGPNTEEGFIEIVSAVASEAKTYNIKSFGISWGGPEDTWTSTGREYLHKAVQDCCDQGVTVTVAAGDNGSSDGEGDSSSLHVDLPACLDNVLAVGGTRIEISKGLPLETVWGSGNSNGATGGGQSIYQPRPFVQDGSFLTSVNQTIINLTGRGVPDVSCLADPATGFIITIDGEQMVIGGTSAGAPFWAGILALISEQRGHIPVTEPFNQQIYKLSHNLNLPVVTDVVQGTNGEWISSPIWDGCTGIGSPKIKNLLSAFSS